MKHIFLSVLTFIALCLLGLSTGWTAIVELDGTNAEVTAATTNGYNNSNTETTSVLTLTGTNGTRLDLGAVTGNIQIVAKFPSFTNNNGNRFTVGAGSDFTGTLSVTNGIWHTVNTTHLGSGLTLDKGILMSNGSTFTTDLTIADGSWGGLRPSASMKYSGNITGNGDLVVVTENVDVLTLDGTAKTYTGVTSVGTIQGGTNVYATLTLGANEILPSTTVLEIGKSQNSAYSYSNADSVVNWNGKKQTIAGLYGIGKISMTGGSTMNIALADGNSYEFSGMITGAGTTSINITGSGTQTLVNATGITNLTVGDDAMLNVASGNVFTAANITFSKTDALLAASSQLRASTLLTVTGLTDFDLNGEDLTLSSNTSFTVTNSNAEDTSILTWKSVDTAIAQMTYNKKISGNIRLIVDLSQNENNSCRLMLNNAENDIQGGVEVRKGTFRTNTAISLPNNTIDLNGGALMVINTAASVADYTLNLMENGGALRLSGLNNFTGKITGVGSLEIVNDDAVILTNTANDYQGDTLVNKTTWRSDNPNHPAVLKLGAAGVLPDTTVVRLGEGVGTGTSTLNLQSFTETVAGLSGSNKGIVTGTVGSKLILNDNTDQTYAGQIRDNATVVKRGTGTWYLTGNNVANTSAALEISAGTVQVRSDSSLPGNVRVTGNSTLLVDAATSGYERVLLQSKYHSDVVDYTGAEIITNMDKIANTAYFTNFETDIWGSSAIDQDNMNALCTTIVNTTDASITLDFGYFFRNKVYLSVTEDGGSTEVVLGWNETETEKGATGTGSYTFKPGVGYTIEARLYRYNKTIGAQGGGINGVNGVLPEGGTLVGLGAKVQRSTGEYLPLNYLASGSWTFEDGSFETYGLEYSVFDHDIDIAADATLTVKNYSPTASFEYQNDFTGTGTVRFDSESGTGTTIFNGNAEGNVLVADGITFTTTTGATVAGTFQMEDGAVYVMDKDTGTLEIGSFAGAGTYRVDVDSFQKTTGVIGPFLDIAGTIDVEDLVLELVTDNPQALVNGLEVKVFADGTLTAEQMASLLPEDSIWYVVQGADGPAYQVNAAAIPEPSTWLLLVLGAFGLLYLKKRS